MNVVIIGSVIVGATVLLGAILGVLFYRFSNIVTGEQRAAEMEKDRYNLALTMGYKIPVDADAEMQIKSARILAAKRAAALPRGANVRIGNVGDKMQPAAFDGISDDPLSAVRIANVHGWQFLHSGGAAAAQATAPAATATVAVAAPPAKSPDALVPGEDYPYIEITDEMSPAEVRKARIANAKARSAAVKALKEAGVAAGAPAVESTTVAPTAPADVAPVQPVVGAVGEPVPNVDYSVIEITDDMDPAEIRKARIANAKAKSAAMKALKAAGGGSAPVAPAPTVATEEPASAPVESATVENVAAAVPADIPRPQLIEITDDMDPAEVRKARIENAKAKSAYNKALKAAGIDPSTVSD